MFKDALKEYNSKVITDKTALVSGYQTLATLYPNDVDKILSKHNIKELIQSCIESVKRETGGIKYNSKLNVIFDKYSNKATSVPDFKKLVTKYTKLNNRSLDFHIIHAHLLNFKTELIIFSHLQST